MIVFVRADVSCSSSWELIYLCVCLVLFVVLFMGKFKGYEPLTFSVFVAADHPSFTFLFIVIFMFDDWILLFHTESLGEILHIFH